MKFPGSNGKIISVRANQKTAWQCYAKSLKVSPSEERHRGDPPIVAHIAQVDITDLDPRSESHYERPSPIDELDDLQVGKLPGQCTKISQQLNPKLRQRLIEEISKNTDLFAWSSANMPGIDPNLICHRLAIHKEVKPIAQRKIKVRGERRDATITETQKLMNAGFIREVRYTMVFNQIWKRNMRLNLEKCVFGVQGGKFLGFMITSRGIEANPEKYKAIIQMQSPQTVKDIQRLAGRLVSLSRFITRLVEKIGPIFTLFPKPKNFEWTDQCEEAFSSFKVFLTIPPVLQRPDHHSDLLLYLVVAEGIISAVMVQEHHKV
uniref:Retrovirus-related Pol polyprotein from transposon 412 family n=1 Tax=Cajanus cajan TaxID=3821 RepID=A0A151S606_CAJCA|nr:Retrovirus-related Pol polyprotein from transposon 412 family [Cajanus cajan]